MSKPKVARVGSPAQAISLDDVTITCYRQPHFISEDGEQPITIPGRQLGQVLAWLAQTRPGILGKATDDLFHPGEVGLKLEGLGGA